MKNRAILTKMFPRRLKKYVSDFATFVFVTCYYFYKNASFHVGQF